jgi:hypothetical protein
LRFTSSLFYYLIADALKKAMVKNEALKNYFLALILFENAMALLEIISCSFKVRVFIPFISSEYATVRKSVTFTLSDLAHVLVSAVISKDLGDFKSQESCLA